MGIDWLVHMVIVFLVVGMIAGLLYWLVQKAPFIADPIKPMILWFILAICVIFVIYYALLPMLGSGMGAGPVWHR